MSRMILFVATTCYFDTNNGASVACRALMECLARHGFATEAVTGTVFEGAVDIDAEAFLVGEGLSHEVVPTPFAPDDHPEGPATLLRLDIRGVVAHLFRSPVARLHVPDEAERRGFLRLCEATMDRLRPDVVVTYGGDELARQVRASANARGLILAFALHNFNYRDHSAFTDVDVIFAPSRFVASFYRSKLGLDCRPLPNLIDFDRARAEVHNPRFVTFVNPSYEKGVFVFARIADELGRRRPDIPLLVVEGRGSERMLVDCGLDLRAHGNVNVLGHVPDIRDFWGVTKICLMPSLWWEAQGLVAIEAMINGIPVLGSDRGALPETLGDGGIVLPVPPRLNPGTRELPTPTEVEPWVKAIIGLWDDPVWYAEQGRRALAETRRWASEVLEPRIIEFFDELSKSASSALRPSENTPIVLIDE